MRFRIPSITLTAAALLFAVSPANAALFSFVNNGPLDGADDTGSMTVDGITLSTVGFAYPDLSAAPTIGGILTAGGETNILGSGGLGVDNPTIGANDFQNAFGPGSEQSNFNFDETWTLQFDKAVVFDEIQFASLSGADSFSVDIGGSLFSVTSDPASNPFSGLEIDAGTDISFTFNGDSNDDQARIDSFTVSVVAIPEPSSFALLGIGAFATGLRRRKR